MNWRSLQIAADGTHHRDANGVPTYSERFDDVLKFHEPGLAPVLKAGRAWHINHDGTPGYSQRYQRTFGYYEGLAVVAADDGWHHITETGEAAYPQRFDWCGNFQNERCTVRDFDGSYRHIILSGEAAYSQRWDYAGDYRDGIAVVQDSNGYSSHIDHNGILTHGSWFVDLDVFHKGYARARDEDGWCHIDVEGEPVYQNRFAAVEPFYNGQARVERFDGALEVIDENGQALLQLRPPRRSEFAHLSADMVGFWRTQTIGAAVQLGVPDALPATEAMLASLCGLTHDGAHRLCRALGELHLTHQENGNWDLTPRGEFLKSDHPLTLADAALEYAGPFSDMWSRLPDALSSVSDWTRPDIFGDVANDAARRPGHHRMLQSYARHDYAKLAQIIEVQGDERIIDAGGGLGVLAQLLLAEYPAAQITVLERPEVVQQAHSSISNLRWHSGDLFKPWGLAADVVLLSRVLHDWSDEDACEILAHVRAALPTGGRVFIIEMLIPDNGVAGGLCDLHLLMATGGRERSVEDFTRLLESTGFKLQNVQNTTALPSVLVGVAR